MRNYILNNLKDDHGQPRQLFKVNLENNVSKAIDQLSGVCAGILCDGVVNDAEAQFFVDWVHRYGAYEPVWPFTNIVDRIGKIFADRTIDDDERHELRDIMSVITGQTETPSPAAETYSSRLPLNQPPPSPITLSDRQFAITGRFAYGTRRKIIEAIQNLGGFVQDGFPTIETHYLVIGVFASRDWYYTNYGRKIERAVELRNEGSGIAIISEEHWKRFLT